MKRQVLAYAVFQFSEKTPIGAVDVILHNLHSTANRHLLPAHNKAARVPLAKKQYLLCNGGMYLWCFALKAVATYPSLILLLLLFYARICSFLVKRDSHLFCLL